MMGSEPTVTCTIDGSPLEVPAGRTAAAALMIEGDRARLRDTRGAGEPRGMFCGIGVCFDCLVHVDGRGPLRACLLEVEDGMAITTAPPGRAEGEEGASHE